MSQNHCWPSQLRFGKTIEKTLLSMVNLRKSIQWWWSVGSKTIENHRKQWYPRKKSYHPIALKKLPPSKSSERSQEIVCTDIFLWGMTALLMHLVFPSVVWLLPTKHSTSVSFSLDPSSLLFLFSQLCHILSQHEFSSSPIEGKCPLSPSKTKSTKDHPNIR